MDGNTNSGQTMIFLKKMSTPRLVQQARFVVTILALMIVPVCAVGAQDFVDHTIKFTPNALVHGWKAFDIRKWQEGTINGVYYEFGRDGYGSFRRHGADQKTNGARGVEKMPWTITGGAPLQKTTLE